MATSFYIPYDPMCDTEVAEHWDFHNRLRANIPMNSNDTPSPIANDMISKVMGEKTPDGLDQHTAGAKLDAGKPMVSLVLGGFSQALMEVAKVGTFGARKYTPNGWKKVEDGQNRYTDAMMRHWLYEMAGEDIDPDSDLHHAAHLAWNALARLELILESDPTNGRNT